MLERIMVTWMAWPLRMSMFFLKEKHVCLFSIFQGVQLHCTMSLSEQLSLADEPWGHPIDVTTKASSDESGGSYGDVEGRMECGSGPETVTQQDCDTGAMLVVQHRACV